MSMPDIDKAVDSLVEDTHVNLEWTDTNYDSPWHSEYGGVTFTIERNAIDALGTQFLYTLYAGFAGQKTGNYGNFESFEEASTKAEIYAQTWIPDPLPRGTSPTPEDFE